MSSRFICSLLASGTLAFLAGCGLGQARFASIEPRCGQNPGACKQMCAVNRNSTECAVATVQTAEAIAAQGNPDHLSGPSLGELRRQLLVICNQGVKRACTAYAQVGDMIMSSGAVQRSTELSAASASGDAGASAISSERPVANGEVVLYDPDSKAHDPNVGDSVDANESKRLLDRLFHGRFLSDRKQCPTAAGSLASDRQSGRFVPKVAQVARGSFTAPHASQSVYVVMVGECSATHADNWGSETLVVLDGDAIVTRVPATGSTTIGGISDLDGDGRQELLLKFTYAGQGTSSESAKLALIDGSALTTVKDFGQLSGSNCDGIATPKQESVSVVRARRGADGQVTYAVEKKSRPCQ